MLYSNSCYLLTVQGYRALWTGMGAQLARDVPFSAICWSTLEPVSFFPSPKNKELLFIIILSSYANYFSFAD